MGETFKLFEHWQAEADAAERRKAAEAIRDGIADLRRQTSEHGGRTAAALEALLALTERESQETDERERAMLALTRRSVWISAAAAGGTFISTAVAVVAVVAS